MPQLALLPQADFEAKTTLYEDVPAGDKSLSYSIRLPSNWTEARAGGISNYSLSEKIFGEIALFYGPPEIQSERSRFSLQALKLEYQLTAEQWLLQYLLNNGYSIQALEASGDDRAEALFVFIQNDTSFLVRAAAVIDGKRIVMAQYFIPIEKWDEQKVMQAQSIASFNLTSPDTDYVEDLEKYQFLDVAEMYYPKSWEIRSPPLRSIDFMDAHLLNVVSGSDSLNNGELSINGKIDVELAANYALGSIEEGAEKTKNDYKKDGITLQEVIETPAGFRASEVFQNLQVEVYAATNSKRASQSYEVWIASMQAGDYYYYLGLVTPSRDEDYFMWCRNTQTFKQVIALLTPQEISVNGK